MTNPYDKTVDDNNIVPTIPARIETRLVSCLTQCFAEYDKLLDEQTAEAIVHKIWRQLRVLTNVRRPDSLANLAVEFHHDIFSAAGGSLPGVATELNIQVITEALLHFELSAAIEAGKSLEVKRRTELLQH